MTSSFPLRTEIAPNAAEHIDDHEAVHRRLNQAWIEVDVAPTGVDDTAVINEALADARSDKVGCRIRGEEWLVSQLVIPNGSVFGGDYLGEFAEPSTLIQQIPGTQDDMIVFATEPSISDGAYRVGPCRIMDMYLRGSGGTGPCLDTIGSGICFRDVEGEMTINQTMTILARVFIRGFPGHGVHGTGGVPIFFDHVNSFYNAGFGYYFEGGPVQAAHMLDCDGDGNLLGLVGFKDMTRLWDHFQITNLRSEQARNPHFGSEIGNRNVLVFDNCPDAVFNINGITHASSVADGATFLKPGDAIVIDGAGDHDSPTIIYEAIHIHAIPSHTGDEPVLMRYESGAADITVPRGSWSGQFGKAPLATLHGTGSTAPHHVVGSGEFHGTGAAAGEAGYQSAGELPGYTWWETDADDDEKLWSMLASGGNLSVRTHTDDGDPGEVVFELQRTGIDVTAAVFAAPVHGTTIEATTNAGGVIVRSPDGTRWRLAVSNAGVLTPTLV